MYCHGYAPRRNQKTWNLLDFEFLWHGKWLKFLKKDYRKNSNKNQEMCTKLWLREILAAVTEGSPQYNLKLLQCYHRNVYILFSMVMIEW